jgi:salicylate hydroxylase
VHIFEAAEELGEIGAGLTVFHRTWELLKLLGCQESLKRSAFTYSRMGSSEISNDAVFQLRKSDQKDGYTFLNLTVPGELLIILDSCNG